MIYTGRYKLRFQKKIKKTPANFTGVYIVAFYHYNKI